MRKAKRFNEGDIVEDESEIIFDNRSVKDGKLPSETTSRKADVSMPSKPKPRIVKKVEEKVKVEAPKVSTKAEPSPGPLGFKAIRSFISGLGKPYGAEKFEKEQRIKKGLEGGGMKAGGKVSSASKRADGCAIRGKTRA